jgi:hypothetical protein
MAVVEYGSHLMAIMKTFNGQGDGPAGDFVAVVTFNETEETPVPVEVPDSELEVV